MAPIDAQHKVATNFAFKKHIYEAQQSTIKQGLHVIDEDYAGGGPPKMPAVSPLRAL